MSDQQVPNTAITDETPSTVNGTAPSAATLDPAIAQKIAQLRSQVRESFGKVVLALMMLPRYKAQSIGDLQSLVLDPLIRDRVAIAYRDTGPAAGTEDVAGMAIWASVSEEVDASIREQIRGGVFPIRLKPQDWTSGSINWLLDVIAPDQRAVAGVIANFKQVVKEGSLRLHPLIGRLVDAETLRKMGAERLGDAEKADDAAPEPVAASS